MRRGVRLAIGVAVLLGIQAMAWLTYQAIEDQRQSSDPATFAYETVSGSAPALDAPLEYQNGKLTQLSDYASEPVVVHFWATWCAPCRTELPALLALANAPRGERHVRFLLISVDENWATVRHFFDGEIPPGVVRDGTGAAKRAFSVETLPETFVLRRGSALSARIRGARDWRSAAAREALAALAAPQ